MSRLIAAVVRNSEPMPPSPPSFETAAANSADVHDPIGARMMGTSMPRTSQSGVFNITRPPGRSALRRLLQVIATQQHRDGNPGETLPPVRPRASMPTSPRNPPAQMAPAAEVHNSNRANFGSG